MQLYKPKYATSTFTMDIIKQDVRNLTLDELKKLSRQVFSTANKRIDRLQRQVDNENILSPALRAVKETGGRFAYGGKDLKALQKEFSRAQAFLEMETSTVSGAQAYTKPLVAIFGDAIFNPQFAKFAFDALHKMQEAMPAVTGNIGTDAVLKNIYERMTQDIQAGKNLIGLTEQDVEEWINGIMQDLEDTYVSQVNEMTKAVDDSLEMLLNGFNKIW